MATNWRSSISSAAGEGVDAGDIALVLIGVLGTFAILYAGFRLDRRSHRNESTKWMDSWTILTRVRRDLFNRLYGPLRLQDQRADGPVPEKKKRKVATPRRKRPRKLPR